MSLLPLILDYYDPLEFRRSRFDDWDLFGLGISPSEIQRLLMLPRLSKNLRPPKQDSTAAVVGKDGFQACIDVKQFRPNEISVRTVDNTVIIQGKHEERNDEHGTISRHFIRKYTLPKEYDAKEVVSTLSSDGVLTVKAPPPPRKEIEGNERIVHIQQTGPAHLNVKENKAEGDGPDNID